MASSQTGFRYGQLANVARSPALNDVGFTPGSVGRVGTDLWRTILQLGVVLVLSGLCSAQVPGGQAGELHNVAIQQRAGSVKVIVTLTNGVTPTLIVTTDPDRLVLDLPNTISKSARERIDVNENGIARVRVGQHSARPPVTRVVVDLDTDRPFDLTTEGKTITLTVFPAATKAWDRSNNHGPVPAASGGLPNVLLDRPSTDTFVRPPTESVPATSVAQDENPHISFRVKAVAEGAAYLEGGRNAGLAKSMRLSVREPSPAGPSGMRSAGATIAELEVTSVAQSSAVTKVLSSNRPVRPGDWAYLSAEDAKLLVANNVAPLQSASNVVPSGPKVEQLRNSSSVADTSPTNRLEGRIGLDSSGYNSSGATQGRSRTLGINVWTHSTRLFGTHWNLEGYWRTRYTKSTMPLQDPMEYYNDRAYLMELTYDNPDSPWVAGVGRLYLPWAPVLDTLDGGYVGCHLGWTATAGVFLGSIPNLNTWHYSPNQRIGGGFVNFKGDRGDFHYDLTTGGGMVTQVWQIDRPFMLLDTSVSYKSRLMLYYSLVFDSPQGVTTQGIKPGAGIDRSYLTANYAVNKYVKLMAVHNYFRDVPTLATQLVGTTTMNKLVYQGVIPGLSITPHRFVTLGVMLNQGSKTGDAKRSLNQIYSVTWNQIPHTSVRADLRYSKFVSPFCQGNLQQLTFSRPSVGRVSWVGQIGRQDITSPFTTNTRFTYADLSLDTNLGWRTFLQSGVTIEHGLTMNSQSWYLSLGYRFDTAARERR